MLPDHFNVDRGEGKERTICDYLAGMTDRFAVEEYEKLFNPSLFPKVGLKCKVDYKYLRSWNE
jgi:dGTPase